MDIEAILHKGKNMDMDDSYHFSHDFMSLLIDTIPRITRSKDDVFMFFRGAGVSEDIMSPSYLAYLRDKYSIYKHQIARQILTTLNEKGDTCLRQRREVVKRIVEFDSFETCWDDVRKEAIGFVAEVRRILNEKDSFTRMRQEYTKEREKHIQEKENEQIKKQQMIAKINSIKEELFKLFSETNASKRGKALEGVLNNLFKAHGISIREAFHIVDDNGAGISEQIDGAIELDGHVYLVEMKWWDRPLGVGEIAPHIVRLFGRDEARGMFISNSKFTAPAISQCKDALSKKTIILCELDEIVYLLEQHSNLNEFIRDKTRAAIADKNPYLRICGY